MENVIDVLLSGVDFVNFADTGGKECLEFISFKRRGIETVVAFIIFLVSIIVGFRVRQLISVMIKDMV